MARKRTILSRTLKVLGFILLPVTLAAFYCTYIPPDVFWPAGVVALFIPHLLFIQAVLAIYWLFRRAVWILIPLALLAIGFGFIRSTVALRPAEPEGEPVFSVISYNVDYFHGKDPENHEPLPDIARDVADAIVDSGADLVCLQEYYDFTETDPLSEAMEAGYSLYFPAAGTDSAAGIGFLSKWPVTGQGELPMTEAMKYRAAYVDIARGTDTVRVVNIHLPAINMLETGPFGRKRKRESLLSNLRDQQIGRTEDLNILMDFVADSPYPLLICGDFNETPYSNTYRQLNSRFDNSFEEAGNGLGATYRASSVFLLRIDHQFYGDRLQAVAYSTLRDYKFSDHFPIYAAYDFNRR